MTGFDAYKLYLSVKLHFTTDKYNFFQYNGKSRASLTTYNQRKDKYFFDKLANRHEDDIVDYYVANLIKEKHWVGDITKAQGEKVYLEWKEKITKLPQTFSCDVDALLNNIEEPYTSNFELLFKPNYKGTHPILLTTFFKKAIGLETLVIFEKIFSFVDKFDEKLTDPVWQNTKNKIIKYEPFLTLDVKTFKKILKEKVV